MFINIITYAIISIDIQLKSYTLLRVAKLCKYPNIFVGDVSKSLSISSVDINFSSWEFSDPVKNLDQ